MDAETIYKERWASLIRYCLLITQFTDKQGKNIQKPCYNAILRKMGFNRNFPRAVTFSPNKYRGKQLMDYGTYQHTSYLEIFVAYIRQEKEMEGGLCKYT